MIDGAAQCVCDAGYAGDQCDTCADGYQDNDGDGTCLPSCEITECSEGFECTDASGTAQCIAVPPGPITRLAWSDWDGITLHWSPPNTYWEQVLVVRSTTGIPTTPSDGAVVFEGRARHYEDQTAQPGTTYYYAVWAVANGLYSPQPATAEVTGDWIRTDFSQSGTFTSSATLPYMTVYAWGAGGGGGLRNTTVKAGKGGGGGFSTATVYNSTPTTYRVTVGKAGRSGAPTQYEPDDLGRGGYGNCPTFS